jgi:hypothetical protein
LRAKGILTLPTAVRGRAVLRSVQCPVTDPVSFALLAGASRARFPNVRGWSIQDTAARAVAEHRAWLAAPQELDGVTELGMLFSAGRAALLMETIHDGEPELALTAEVVARQLADRSPHAGAVAPEAYEEYRECRAGRREHGPTTVSALRALILALRPYRDPSVGEGSS